MRDPAGSSVQDDPLVVAHWGTYRAEMRDGEAIGLRAFEEDPAPSPIGDSMVETRTSPSRIARPAVRKGYREGSAAEGRDMRGRDSFVEVSWDEALDLAARELDRVRAEHGNASVYAGSYGWASAGRFHHAQSQLRRFMNLFGGSTTARDTYSYAAAEVILPHVVAPLSRILQDHTSWRSIAEAKSLVVAFGGMAVRNGQVNPGGVGRHTQRDDMLSAHAAGARFVNIGPSRADVMDDLDAEWLPIRPNTDTALMLGLAHTLVSEGLHDRTFLDRYTVGFERFLPYLTGESDGQPKDARWAAAITGIDAETIAAMARRMAAEPTIVCASWSLTRQHHGEQPVWMSVVLAAMLGGIGLPGRGFASGLSGTNAIGSQRPTMPVAALPSGYDPEPGFIPVARIADMLENPGGTFTYNGRSHTYPEARLIYWVGGNPFHHHQDLNRLRRAWQRPETIVVNEPFWTPLARFADIVLPATVTMERDDIAASPRDAYIVAARKAAEPFGEARSDHRIFAGLAQRLRAADAAINDFEAAFTGGRDEDAWLRRLYDETRKRAANDHHDLPDYDDFVRAGYIRLPDPPEAKVLLKRFRDDPEGARLSTPSGRIEIFSETIEGFGIDGLPGHPVWREPAEWLGGADVATWPLHLVSHQPERRLHSQLDSGGHSRAGKLRDREPCRMHPDEGRARGISDGDPVRIFNNRGACLSVAQLDDGVRPGVVMLATGAWYDPDWEGDPTLCKHGNPNVLTPDLPTSGLGQGPGALTCLVEVEAFTGPLPEVTAFTPPKIEPQSR